MTGGPIPELLTGRRDRPGASVWAVERGVACRGEAWTDLLGRAMRVPFDGGAHGRLIRAHELMHARVSPIRAGAFDAWGDLDARCVECAEEFRVNHLLARIGFELGELRDGSERLTGERLAAERNWGELACFAAAVCGTRALADLASGVRRVSPEWAKGCRAIERDLLRLARRVPVASLASTVLGDGALPEGFAVHTRAFAAIISSRTSQYAPPGTGVRGRRRRPAPTGSFAPLVFDESVVLDRAIGGGVRPRRVPAPSGRRVVRAIRLVTDPSRRVFERRRVVGGGVVVVDQSGSMALSCEELASLLARAPGALIIGYSHAPGSTGEPNAWVLADRGRAASTVRSGNVGNGVDGPVLRFALSRRRCGEPFVWICDGQVTDAGDHADEGLAAECARLVIRHGIQMVGSVDGAIQRLGARKLPAGPRPVLGRVGAAAGRMA